MANGMASLMVGSSGLRSAQTALNTTAHNLSNVNTQGYTRQQVTFTDTTYANVFSSSIVPGKYGLGVDIGAISRVRNDFIDRSYRTGYSRLGFYESQANAVYEVEDWFGEMQGVTYQQHITDLYNSINELTKNPTSTIARSSLIQNATAFIDRSQAIYSGLKDYQITLNTEVSSMVDKINELGQKIYSLNKSISKVEAGGVERANDLRDTRDLALDELSQYLDIDYYETTDGQIIISAENIPFVSKSEVNTMDVRQEGQYGLLIPEWPAYEKDVFSFEKAASNANNNDKGKLKGLLVARGTIDVNYQDVPVMPDKSDYDLTTAEGMAQYNSAMDDYQKQQDYYNKYIEPSAILSAIAGFDKLVNGIVTALNDVLCPEKEVETTTEMTDDEGNPLQADKYVYNASQYGRLYDRFGNVVEGTDNGDGTYSYTSGEKLYIDEQHTTAEDIDSMTYLILDMDKAGFGTDEDETVGVELFKRKGTERYIKITGEDGTTTYVRNNLNAIGYEIDYTLGNLLVNPEASQNVGKIPLSTIHGKEDFAKANELIDTFSNKFASLNPQDYAKADFNTFYNDFIGEFATMGSVLTKFVNNQTTMVNGYDNQRLQTSGVSSDEELQKMIKYQHAYNAASRYVNVVSEMMEHLLTSLGA